MVEPTAIGLTISRRIGELRALHKMSLQELADRVGTSKSYLWELEQGRSRNPTIEMTVAIAGSLGVSLDYLTGLSAAMPSIHPEALRIACEVDALLRRAAPATPESET